MFGLMLAAFVGILIILVPLIFDILWPLTFSTMWPLTLGFLWLLCNFWLFILPLGSGIGFDRKCENEDDSDGSVANENEDTTLGTVLVDVIDDDGVKDDCAAAGFLPVCWPLSPRPLNKVPSFDRSNESNAW